MTTTITPAVGVVPRLVELAGTLRADAERIAADLADMATMEDLTRVEEEILAQLADVRRRKTERAVAEHEHRAALSAAVEIDRLADRLREASAPPRPDEVLRATGLLPAGVEPTPVEVRDCGHCGGDISYNRISRRWEHLRDGEAECFPGDPDTCLADPCPDDGLTAPGVLDSREEVARLTGGHPVVPDDATPTGDVSPGRVVATGGPTQTQPDPGAAHPVPNPPSPAPAPATQAAPTQRGPRHKREKGGRK